MKQIACFFYCRSKNLAPLSLEMSTDTPIPMTKYTHMMTSSNPSTKTAPKCWPAFLDDQSSVSNSMTSQPGISDLLFEHEDALERWKTALMLDSHGKMDLDLESDQINSSPGSHDLDLDIDLDLMNYTVPAPGVGGSVADAYCEPPHSTSVYEPMTLSRIYKMGELQDMYSGTGASSELDTFASYIGADDATVKGNVTGRDGRLLKIPSSHTHARRHVDSLLVRKGSGNTKSNFNSQLKSSREYQPTSTSTSGSGSGCGSHVSGSHCGFPSGTHSQTSHSHTSHSHTSHSSGYGGASSRGGGGLGWGGHGGNDTGSGYYYSSDGSVYGGSLYGRTFGWNDGSVGREGTSEDDRQNGEGGISIRDKGKSMGSKDEERPVIWGDPSVVDWRHQAQLFQDKSFITLIL